MSQGQVDGIILAVLALIFVIATVGAFWLPRPKRTHTYTMAQSGIWYKGEILEVNDVKCRVVSCSGNTVTVEEVL